MATFPHGEGGMNTFSENGNDFVGRLLHEGGVSRRSFSAFSPIPSTVGEIQDSSKGREIVEKRFHLEVKKKVS